MDSALLFQLLDDPTAHSQHPEYPRPSSSLFPTAGNFSLFISRAPFPRDAPGGFQAAKCPLRSESPLLPRGDPGSPAEHSLEQTLVIPCASDPGDPGAQTRRPEGHRGYLYPYPHIYFFFPFFFGNSGFKRDLNSHFWGFLEPISARLFTPFELFGVFWDCGFGMAAGRDSGFGSGSWQLSWNQRERLPTPSLPSGPFLWDRWDSAKPTPQVGLHHSRSPGFGKQRHGNVS